jgi:hypothetical protein
MREAEAPTWRQVGALCLLYLLKQHGPSLVSLLSFWHWPARALHHLDELLRRPRHRIGINGGHAAAATRRVQQLSSRTMAESIMLLKRMHS